MSQRFWLRRPWPAKPPIWHDASTSAPRDLTTLGRLGLTEIVTYRLDHAGGETANLIRFLDPEDIAGTDLLSIDKTDGNTDQWMCAVGLFAGQLFEMLLMPALLGLRLRKPRAVTEP